MHRNLAVLGIILIMLGALLILIALPTAICQPPNGTIIGGCGHNMIYTEFYSGIILVIIGAILFLLSIRMKSKPSTESALGMMQTHRLAGIAVFLWGFYLFYTSLTTQLYGTTAFFDTVFLSASNCRTRIDGIRDLLDGQEKADIPKSRRSDESTEN